MFIFLVSSSLVALLFLYLYLVEQAMVSVPEEVSKAAPHRWTEEEIRETYETIKRSPIDVNGQVPPKLERRYIVVGGSGLVGGHIILKLLARGESPESIRLLDFKAPNRHDMLTGPASKVSFIKTDITSQSSVREAFTQPWPTTVSSLPLTIFHTAAAINPSDRAKSLYPKIEVVNVTGTANVLSAAKAAGADVFISTSSAPVCLQPPNFWIAPWKKYPDGYVQILDERDINQPLRPHEQYFGNYAVSKARAERIVLAANSASLKTGCIRPGCGIYGNQYDQTAGLYLRRGSIPTWTRHIITNHVSAHNVSIAHLLLEKAVLRKNAPAAGKTFVVSDPNPPVLHADFYRVLSTLSITGFKAQYLPPLPLLLLCYPIEQYHILQNRFPGILPALPQDIQLLQPGLFNISSLNTISIDSNARKAVEDGGLGYKGVCTTLQGLCMSVKDWNDNHAGVEHEGEPASQGLVTEAQNVATVPVATRL